IGSVPNAAGANAVVRNVDGLLGDNTILVNVSTTIGGLFLESGGGIGYTLTGTDGGHFIFDTGVSGGAAKLDNIGAHNAVVDVDMVLNSDLEIKQTAPAANTLALNGKISGTGGIIYNNDNGTLHLGTTEASGVSTSDFSGGFHLIGSTDTGLNANKGLRITADGSLFGTGSYNDTDAENSIQSLIIGDGTPGRYYTITTASDGQHFTVDASVRIAGNLYTGVNAGANRFVTFRSDDPGYVATGTWQLITNVVSTPASGFAFEQDLEGPGGFVIGGDMLVSFYGNNTFSGGLWLPGNYTTRIGIGSNSALGTGTVWLSGTVESGGNAGIIFESRGGSFIDNEFVFDYGVASNPRIRFEGAGDLTLSHTGTSTMLRTFHASVANNKTVIFPASHVLTGTADLTVGNAFIGTGTLRFEGAHEYTGNTYLYYGALAVGDDLSLGTTGTLFMNYASNGNYNATLSSYGKAITLSNHVVFSENYNNGQNNTFGLTGVDGVLTLDADESAELRFGNTSNMSVTGTVVFGGQFKLTGSGGLGKAGAGLLVLNSGDSDYTGTTSIANGTLRVAAAGDITLGRASPGENYLGTGDIVFVSGNTVRTLELVAAEGNAVTLASNLAFNGNSTVNTASINITDTAGAVSGDITTSIDAASAITIGGNANGWLRAPGDIIKTGAATMTWSGGNLVAQNLVIREGTLDLGNANLIRSSVAATTGNLAGFTLGDATLRVSGSQTFANTLFNLAGSGTLDFTGNARLTFQNVGSWNGSLAIINWDGSGAATTVGNGNTQFRFTDDVLTVFDYAMLSGVQFHDIRSDIDYAPGAKLVTTNAGAFHELIPVGLSTVWTSGASGNSWSLGGNWQSDVAPNGVGAMATFSSTLNLGGLPVYNDISGLTLGGLVFRNDTGGVYAITGAGINLAVGDSDGAASLMLQNNNSVSINTDFLNLQSLTVANTQGSGTLTIAAAITGTQGLIKTGSGVLALENVASDFSGGVALLDGELRVGNDTAGATPAGPLGSGTLALHGGTLTPAGNTHTIANATDFAGVAAIGGTNNLTLTGDGVISDAGAGLIVGGTVTLGGNFSGTGHFTKSGTGTLLMTGGNTFSGGFTVLEGVTGIDNAAALGSGTL
ncbi:MAG: autotransporter-associated beta strand repeat-containing protein, partial [Verrucomicrobiales bacterium]|nr:autotransporter-associated beta strand repeat-containing protein [Verrucomicrobiales bacterium]